MNYTIEHKDFKSKIDINLSKLVHVFRRDLSWNMDRKVNEFIFMELEWALMDDFDIEFRDICDEDMY